jgi:type I restriction enzyme S subunit
VSTELLAQEPSAKYLQPQRAERVELIAQAPGGVARLRELILTLAVQGKLVPQDPADEPASALLKQIRAEKDRLIAEGKIKRDKPLAETAEKETPFELPEGWVWERLGVIGDIFSGNSINSTEKESKYAIKIGLPYIATKDVGYGLESLDYENGIRIPFGETKFKVALPGSVLICAEGGSAGRKCGLTEREICFGNKLFANTPFGDIPPKFILFTYQSPHFIESFRGAMTGIIGGISLAKFQELLIPLPPLAEQKRIVPRVEELMRLCEALDAKAQLEATQHAQLLQALLGSLTASTTPEELAANWQRVAAHFDLLLDRPEAVDALEQTVLQLAVRGLLVPQDPNDEPASELRKKIRAEKDRLIAEGKIKRDKLLPPIAADEQPFDLPQGWEWVPIDSLASVGTGTTPSRENPAYFTDGTTPWVTSGETGQPFIDATEQHVTGVALEQTSLTVYPIGTLIVAMYGQGKTRGQVAELRIPAATNQACAAIVLVDSSAAHRAYVKLVFEKSYDEIRELSAGGAQPNLNVGKVKATLIPLPPLAEQSRIAARVAALRRLCDELRQRLSRAQAQQALLAEALVQEVA